MVRDLEQTTMAEVRSTWSRQLQWISDLSRVGEQVASLQDMGAPGADLENILYLRTVADADRILQSVKKLQSDGGKVRLSHDRRLQKHPSPCLCLRPVNVIQTRV